MKTVKVYDPSRRHAYGEYQNVCETLQGAMGTGGGNIPIVVEVKDEECLYCIRHHPNNKPDELVKP